MSLLIETRITRPGETDKASLTSITADKVVDFDVVGHDSFPTPAWQSQCRKWEISPNQSLTITEARGTFCAPRLAWMLITSGFPKVEVVPEKYAVPSAHASNCYDDKAIQGLSVSGFVGKDSVINALEQGYPVIDVRSLSRFSGSEADPRPQVRAGHIPGSINIHYGDFLSNRDDQVFKDKQTLSTLFKHSGVDITAPVIFSCGSGITACIGALAAYQLGATEVFVYDGSWAEWGADPSLPVATGE